MTSKLLVFSSENKSLVFPLSIQIHEVAVLALWTCHLHLLNDSLYMLVSSKINISSINLFASMELCSSSQVIGFTLM